MLGSLAKEERGFPLNRESHQRGVIITADLDDARQRGEVGSVAKCPIEHGVSLSGRAETRSRWKKVGVARVSASKKVVLLAIFELENTRWQIVDVDELLDLVAGRRCDVSIMERDLNV